MAEGDDTGIIMAPQAALQPHSATVAVQALTPALCPAAASCAPCNTAAYDDVDLDAAALKLDEHSRSLRADMLAHLLDCKRRLGDRQQQAANAAATQAATQLAAKQQELNAASTQLARQREIVKRTGSVLYKAACWRRHLALGCMAWRAWRAHYCRQRRLAAQIQAGTRHYEMATLQRRVFRMWRAHAAAQWRPRVRAQAAAAVEAERQNIRQEAEAAASLQAQRVAELESQLARALAARAALEADTKRAFMRGVCALNIEAMALMKGGLPTGSTESSASQCEPTTAAARSGPAVSGHQPDQPALVEHPQQPVAKEQAGPPQGAEWTISVAPGPQRGPPTGLIPTLSPQMPPHVLLGGMLPSSVWPAGIKHGSGSNVASGAVWGDESADGHTSTALGGRLLPKPAPETAKPIVSITPREPVGVMPLPADGQRHAVRHTIPSSAGSHMRPATALPCSLPSNVPPHVAARLAGQSSAAACMQPLAAPARRQSGHVSAGQKLQQQQPQQQVVSKRCLAGQRRVAAGSRPSGQQLVVRGGVLASHAEPAHGCTATMAGAVAAQWRS